MENIDSNPRPTQTGGLKLMTVFIAVLALHAVVIGGFAIYHLMSGGSSDADLLADKAHKSVKLANDGGSDAASPAEPSTADKSMMVANPSTDATAPATTTAPAPSESTAATETTPSTTILTPSGSATPSGPVLHGPVINPSVAAAPAAGLNVSPESSLLTDTSASPTGFGEGTPYVVKSGDSLARIARLHHTTVAKLKTANSLSSDMLQIGQKMTIPAKSQVASAVTPVPAVRANGIKTLAGSPAVAKNTASSGHHLYTVAKGDTLTRIAHKFKTTPTAIMAANNLTDAAKLTIGKKLKIPSAEARSATNAAPASELSAAEAQSKTSAQLANFIQ